MAEQLNHISTPASPIHEIREEKQNHAPKPASPVQETQAGLLSSYPEMVSYTRGTSLVVKAKQKDVETTGITLGMRTTKGHLQLWRSTQHQQKAIPTYILGIRSKSKTWTVRRSENGRNLPRASWRVRRNHNWIHKQKIRRMSSATDICQAISPTRISLTTLCPKGQLTQSAALDLQYQKCRKVP